MPAGNRRPLYDEHEQPVVDQKPMQQRPVQPSPLPVPALQATADSAFKQPCTLKGLSAAFYAGALGYFLGFVPATLKFKARQWGMIHSQGVASASQLALMSGMYTTVHCICQRIRMVEDGWNRGIAGCSTGLVLGWKSGPWGALQSCASLGLLSALIDLGGGAVEAAEAAALHHLQEIHNSSHQLHQQQLIPTWQVPQHGQYSQQTSVLGHCLTFLADPCAAAAHQQRLPLKDCVNPLHSSSAQQPNQEKKQDRMHSAVGQAVQQLQQLIATPPLMFLGACCQTVSRDSSKSAPSGEVAEVVDACLLGQDVAKAATRSRSR